MKHSIKKILGFLLSVQSIIFINLFIKIKKIFNKNLKIVFFYFPVKSYQDNILEFIDEIKKEKNIEIILAYNLGSSNEVKDYNKAFFLNLGYLKYIYNINIFLSSYVVYEFPKSQDKIYINHDIYDTPWVNPNKEEKLIKTLTKYNYVFLSSDIAVTDLQKKINQYSEFTSDKKNFSLINTGYLKLDHIHKKLKNISFVEDSILIAPTLSSMYPDYNINKFLDQIIEELLKNIKFKIIYRPHPGDKNIETIKKINEKYKNVNNFFLDNNTSYLESYRKSKILITDFSGTAYTYAFSKLRPVIFFSHNEANLAKSNLYHLYYFKDRPTVGNIVQNIDNLNEEIYSIHEQTEFYSNQISLLRSERIKFFKKSIEQNIKNLKDILNVKN